MPYCSVIDTHFELDSQLFKNDVRRQKNMQIAFTFLAIWHLYKYFLNWKEKNVHFTDCKGSFCILVLENDLQ